MADFAELNVDLPLLQRCVAGVLLCRGHPEKDVMRYAETIGQSDGIDPNLGAIVAEVSSVLLTIHSDGRLAAPTNEGPSE